MSTQAIPDGYGTVTPYLIIQGAAQAIEFYQTVFGATERLGLPTPQGRVAHAELEIGNSLLMLPPATPTSSSLRRALPLWSSQLL